MTLPRLKDKVAIVTGGGSGIGQAICQRFAQEGAAVAVLDIDADAAQQTVDTIVTDGGQAAFIECDVTDQAAVDSAFDEVVDRHGGLHIVVNNAGIGHVGDVEATTEQDMDRLYAVNIKGVYNGLRAGVRHMKGTGGAILNLASICSSVGIPQRFAYTATKGAVLTMTYSVACDYVNDNIRCNCIAPGRVHTPFVDSYLAKNYPGKEKEMFDKLSKTQPIGRMGKPPEIAELALFLCCDESSFITGSNFPIDGGFVSLKP